MTKLEQAQLDLNEAALRWLSAVENSPEYHPLVAATGGLVTAATAFRNLAEARGPAPVPQPGHRIIPRMVDGGVRCSYCGHRVHDAEPGNARRARWEHLS